jgi:hypothetical protein
MPPKRWCLPSSPHSVTTQKSNIDFQLDVPVPLKRFRVQRVGSEKSLESLGSHMLQVKVYPVVKGY